ncbi:MAG: redoxin domain-containing protein [Chitinophagaceae bacterium]|nr:redoxin domain-containing protein [Chitinophagaceae bacterium]MCW5926172.1 redoxin domain-containing protein [Chitinophagaceae bacterium]
MKYFFNLFFITLAPFFLEAQSGAAPFADYPLPQFSILLPDSSTVYKKTDLPKGKQVLVMLFSPDCDHCKTETETITKNIDQFKNTHILMVTSQSFDKMVEFYNHYELAKYKGITVGRDAVFFFPSFYKIKFFPFLAIYDKKYNYKKHFEGTPKWEDLKSQLK